MTVQIPACALLTARPPASLAGKPHGFGDPTIFHVTHSREFLVDVNGSGCFYIKYFTFRLCFFIHQLFHICFCWYNENNASQNHPMWCNINSIHTISIIYHYIIYVFIQTTLLADFLSKYISDPHSPIFVLKSNSYSLSLSFLSPSLPMTLTLLYMNTGLRRKAADGCILQPSAASANTIIEMVIFWYKMMTCLQPEISSLIVKWTARELSHQNSLLRINQSVSVV